MAEYVTRTVYVQPSAVAAIEKKYPPDQAEVILSFILAHEISHFIHEASIQADGLTLNASWSIYEEKNYRFDTEEAFEVAKPQMLNAHSEVDIYGLLLLKSLNFSAPLAVLNSLKVDLTEFKVKAVLDPDLLYSVEELQFRIINLEATISILWPTP